MMLQQLNVHMQKGGGGGEEERKRRRQRGVGWIQNLTLFTKINSKQIINLNVKYKTKKFLQDNIKETSVTLYLAMDFYNTKASSIKNDK